VRSCRGSLGWGDDRFSDGSTALSARFDPEELREEIRAYQNAVSGVVLLSGEAVIGKSRLAAQLAAEVAAESHTRLRYQSLGSKASMRHGWSKSDIHVKLHVTSLERLYALDIEA
jgi:MoxR-like ATPase